MTCSSQTKHCAAVRLAVGGRAGDQARQDAGDLHAGEPLAELRVAHDDGEVEAEVGDVRERVARPERERRQHGEDFAQEVLAQRLLLRARKRAWSQMRMPASASAGIRSFSNSAAASASMRGDARRG